MCWCYSMEIEDAGRMLSRALLPFDHSMVNIESITSSRTSTSMISLRVVAEANVEQSQHIEALLWKIHGMIQLIVTNC